MVYRLVQGEFESKIFHHLQKFPENPVKKEMDQRVWVVSAENFWEQRNI